MGLVGAAWYLLSHAATVPPPVTNLTGTVISPTHVVLNWTPPQEVVEQRAFIEIQRYDGEQAFPSSGAYGSSHDDPGAPAQSGLTYKVLTIDASNSSLRSVAQVTLTTPACTKTKTSHPADNNPNKVDKTSVGVGQTKLTYGGYGCKDAPVSFQFDHNFPAGSNPVVKGYVGDSATPVVSSTGPSPIKGSFINTTLYGRYTLEATLPSNLVAGHAGSYDMTVTRYCDDQNPDGYASCNY